MIVNKETRISDLINENSEAINAIASVNKHFRKLKNPVLRRVLAPRVTVAIAAQVGNTTIDSLLKVLEDIGFQVEFVNEEIQSIKENELKEFNTISMKKSNIIEMDVRPILATGVDPFKAIMDKLKTINTDDTLCIINTFEPIPLLNILKERGYKYETERPEDGVVKTYLMKTGAEKENSNTKKDTERPELSYEDLERKYANRLVEIDVRDLEMPLPMVTILEAIENLDADQALLVRHKRLPQYLLPELESRSFVFGAQEIDASNLNLIIYKK